MAVDAEVAIEPVALHRHVFLGRTSARNERRTWLVVGLCTAMMLIEIVGGSLYHSIALVADGIHMSTHAGAMLLAALAYRYARRYAEDERFALGTGKFGDLAAFASAIVLALLAVLIGYEAIGRLFVPERIDFAAAIPIAVLGLVVNAVSALLLGGDDHGHHHGHSHERGHEYGHGHGHGHGHSHDHGHAEASQMVDTGFGTVALGIFEDGVPPRFRLRGLANTVDATLETVRADGARQVFRMIAVEGFLESVEAIAEPHAFEVTICLTDGERSEVHGVSFEETVHDEALHRDNNMRAAYVHVLADSAVSGLVIVGLLLARGVGWTWMDPVMGLVGALVVANWSFGLIRAASAVLLDMTPNPDILRRIRGAIERGGDRIVDLHVWRLGPGHLGAIIALRSARAGSPDGYKRMLAAIPELSHVTVEVQS
jgi:cation diffusion facilitator family transporter